MRHWLPLHNRRLHRCHHHLLGVECLRLHELRGRVQRRGVCGKAVGAANTSLRLLAPAVLLDQPLELLDAVNYVDAFAAVKSSRLQDPDILTCEVAHWHDQTA